MLINGKSINESPDDVEKQNSYDKNTLVSVKLDSLWKMKLQTASEQNEIDNLKKQYDIARSAIQARFDNKVDKVQRGDELLPGVMKMVKVFVAVKEVTAR